ncbi:hypothetical protein UA08_02442 [Talaromyces atroroseus]|uniref:Aminotransferase class V domain-containing protein n=1 Tax=Talaromyces atroroseus TaxID=1441469 RepID=A0A225AWM1_TALAT|nr:hypothetical protein UA08_02442 [Talaromyces atroroseus]OKL61718.1 hypothetical protein UA08_02442 [Talaromyces atroroseus]
MASSDISSIFGARLLSSFPFTAGNININHGSFGAYPFAVREALNNYQRRIDAQPDGFLRYELPELIDKSRSAVAQLINADVDNVVLVPNATTGVNTVLRNLVYEEGDKIVYLGTTYSACEKAVIHIVDTYKPQDSVEAVKVDMRYPMSSDEILKRFEDAISHKGVRIALFDTVSSLPALRLPFEKMVSLCKKYNVLSLVDGAHGVGCIGLDMRSLDADFFLTVRWLYTPRSCAILHVPARNQHLIKTSLPTSHGYNPAERPGRPKVHNPLPASTKSTFVYLFDFVATMDYAPYLCVPDAIKFREEQCGGEDKILTYTITLAKQGADRVASILGTDVLGDDDQRACPLTMVRLPLTFSDEDIKEEKHKSVHAWIEKTMFYKYGAFVPLIYHGSQMWVRLSGQVYLALEDFDKVGHMLSDLCARAAKRKTSHL